VKRLFPIVILLGCVAALVLGIVTLFELRFEAGDVYPAYSSLRADPLGAMAFYESLEKIPGLSVRRDFSANNRLPEDPGTVYLHLGGDPEDWTWMDKDLFQEIQNFLARGGRLIVMFYPQTERPIFGDYDEDETNSVPAAKTNAVIGSKSNSIAAKTNHPTLLTTNFIAHSKTNVPVADKTNNLDRAKDRRSKRNRNQDPSDEERYFMRIDDRWGVHADYQKLDLKQETYQPATVTNRSALSLPRTLPWHSAIVFTNWTNAWHVVYARGTNAVVLERKFGRGSVVMATDSYFVSNEAMAKDRHADLLAWLVGPNRNVVFDEAHFGVVETSGVAALMRKYRLHGLAAGLLLLAGLFIWKNATSLVPPSADGRRDDFIAGKDAAAGFVNLLRRSIAPRDLLAVSFAEWKKAIGAAGRVSGGRVQEAEAVFMAENKLSAGERNPVDAYRRISETLGIRNKKL